MASTISLKTYLSRHFTAAAVLPVITIACLTFLLMMPAVKHRAGVQNHAMARSIAGQICGRMAGDERQLMALAGYLDRRPFRADDALTDLLDAHCGSGESFEALFVVDRAGFSVQAAGLARSRRLKRSYLMGLDLSGRRGMYAVNTPHTPAWSKSLLSTVTGSPAVALTMPTAEGFIIAELTLDTLSDFISHLPVESELLILIMDDRGRVVADSRKRYWGQVLHTGAAAGTQGDIPGTGSQTFELDGLKMLGSVVAVEKTGWKVLVAQPINRAFQPLWDMFSLIGLGLLLALVLALVIGWFLAGKFSLIYASYAKQAAAVADGRYDLEWPRHKTREFGLLSQSIERMAGKISQREKSLKFTQFSFDNAAMGIYYIAADGRILNANQHAADLLGYTREELSGMSVFDIAPSVDDGQWEEIRERRMEKGRYTLESIHRRKDGKQIPVEITTTLLEYEGEQFSVGFVQDITDRKKAKLDLQESEARFKALHNASFGGIVIHDKGTILECNQGLSDITGYPVSQLIGMDGLLLISKESRDLVEKNIQTGYEKPYEAMGVRRNGEAYPIRLESRNIPYRGRDVRVSEFRDITDLKQAEGEREKLRARLAQALKMEAIGTLAGGIAHDFNNILSALMGFTDLAKRNAAGNEKVLGHLEKVSSASLRARDLVGHIMTFSRKTDIEKRLIHMNPIIRETLKFIRASLPSSIEIRQDLGKNDSRVFGDPTQMHQIFMNLFANAGYAMRDRGGVLEVAQDTITIDKADRRNFQELPPGRYVQISVSDTGCGIPKGLIDRVFDPFFTTKQRGEGTGMGLSTVYGIIKEMGGRVTVYSEEGMGTTFTMVVPEQEAGSDKAELLLSQPLLSGEGKLLLVDDESPIIEGTVELLSGMGYEVTGMTSSAEALERIKADPGYFDLILTDLTMPGMSGLELSKKIKGLNPAIPIVLCTGFNQGVTKEVCREAGIHKMVMKPLIASELSHTVYNALKGGDPNHD